MTGNDHHGYKRGTEKQVPPIGRRTAGHQRNEHVNGPQESEDGCIDHQPEVEHDTGDGDADARIQQRQREHERQVAAADDVAGSQDSDHTQQEHPSDNEPYRTDSLVDVGDNLRLRPLFHPLEEEEGNEHQESQGSPCRVMGEMHQEIDQYA